MNGDGWVPPDTAAEDAEALAEYDATREVVQARLRAAIEEAVPEDPQQRRVFIDWYVGKLFDAAPDKAAFLEHLHVCVERALEVEARERGLQ